MPNNHALGASVQAITTLFLVAIVGVTAALLAFSQISNGKDPDPIGLFMIFIVSFVPLAPIVIQYSRFYLPEKTVSEDQLVRGVRSVSIGLVISLVFFFMLLFYSFFVITPAINLKPLAGLISVWWGSLQLPYLTIGPAYTLLLAGSGRVKILTPHPFSRETQALFTSSILLPELRRYALKFIAPTWVSAVLMVYGWYLIFGNTLAAFSFLLIPGLILVCRFLNLTAIPRERVRELEAYVVSVADAFPYRGRTVTIGLLIFTGSLVYFAVLNL